jgi:SAM-dependent methyltransferase
MPAASHWQRRSVAAPRHAESPVGLPANHPEFTPRPALFSRMLDGVGRRARYYWNALQPARTHLSRCHFEQLLAQLLNYVGALPHDAARSLPALGDAVIPALITFGFRNEAAQLATQLCELRATDRDLATLASTARALIAVAEQQSNFRESALDASNRLARAVNTDCATSLGIAELALAPALLAAADHFDRADFSQSARDILARHRPTLPASALARKTNVAVRCAAALLYLDEPGLARPILTDVCQTGPVSSVTLAHAAELWFQLGDLTRGAQTLSRLRRRQIVVRQGILSPDDACFVAHDLRAARAQIAATFAVGGAGTAAQPLDNDDARWQCVARWSATLPAGALVADLGCGSGRYLHALARQRPDLRLVGIDPDLRALATVQGAVDCRPGDLLDLPARTGEFDGVFTVESLEHTLLPARAVAELCRVVRLDGQVLVLDKHRAHQPLSRCQPWERWFEPTEVTTWLAPWCRDVRWQPLPHVADRRAQPLFLSWTAIRG